MSNLRLIFDLDDTLYPERDYALGGFCAAGTWAKATLNVDGMAGRLIDLLDAGHLGQSFKLALAEARPDYTESDLAGLIKAYGAHTPDLQLFDDALIALNHFAGHSLGLITDGHAKTQAAKVAALGIAPRFQNIIYTGALGPDRAFHKPHRRAYDLMEHALRQGPSDHFWYIGDNPTKDFLAPNQMGWTTVLVDRLAHRALRIHPLCDAPEGGAAQIIVPSLEALIPLAAAIRA
jgi:putative hydrolase of the HAD superfamily